MLDGIVHAFKDKYQWKDWALPALLDLINEDKSTGANNFRTLFVYLQNNRHLANTARALFIHRNTLIYRLKKIQSFLDVDLDDENTSAYLYFFCTLLSKNESTLSYPN
jgi:purine catabolism regulator